MHPLKAERNQAVGLHVQDIHYAGTYLEDIHNAGTYLEDASTLINRLLRSMLRRKKKVSNPVCWPTLSLLFFLISSTSS